MKVHVHNILQKTGHTNRQELIQDFLEDGVRDSSDWEVGRRYPQPAARFIPLRTRQKK